MKLYILALALACATSSAVFAQEAEATTTIAPTTEASTESVEAVTEVVTTIAPEGEDKKNEDDGDKMTTTEATSSSEEQSGDSGESSSESTEEKKPEQAPKETFGGRSGGAFFPHPHDPRVMFVPQTVRDPVTGMIYHRRVPFGQGHPPQFRPQPQQPAQPSFDPLGNFNEDQKKRQFFQDLLMTQLSRFEKEVDPMVEQDQNEDSKNSLISILTSVNNLKKILESNQIFNISEIMKTWKEGKLPGQTAVPSAPAAASVAHPQPEIVEQPPQDVVTVAEASPQVRTILLVQPERSSRNQHPGFIIQRQPQQQHPLFIRRYAGPHEPQQLPPRGYAPQDPREHLPPQGYAPQDQGYIAGY